MKQEIKTLSDLLKVKLTIPNYQRPYKWKERNVTQLLNDIFDSVWIQGKIYRIGNIILHSDGANVKNIIDGQQRLITISLLLRVLDESFKGLLLNENFKDKATKNNIAQNYYILKSWIDMKFKSDEEKKLIFKDEILSKCEFVIFTVFKQDEAFQLFDSQNSRGKPLKPFDLLKAFHLREMKQDTEEDRVKCVERWVSAINNKKLESIFNDHLFRIRKWSKNENIYHFTKDEIDEFKGISLHQERKYPYETQIRILEGSIEEIQKNKVLSNMQLMQMFPFQVTMPIINGKRFFEYIDYYIQLKENLFKNNTFKEFYEKYCNYPYSKRSGDSRVRNLYENILLQFLDRFGYIEDFEDFYKAFYKEIYIIRCEKMKVLEETILKSEVIKIFAEIKETLNTDRLKYYHYKKYKITDSEFAKGIGHIVDFIDDSFINKLKDEIKKEGFELEEDSDCYFVPFKCLDKEIKIYIGYKGNFYWYGFRNDKSLIENIKDKIEKLNLNKNNSNWLGWNEFNQKDVEEIPKIISDIKSWIMELKSEGNE